jgi:hypothetical protein
MMMITDIDRAAYNALAQQFDYNRFYEHEITARGVGHARLQRLVNHGWVNQFVSAGPPWFTVRRLCEYFVLCERPATTIVSTAVGDIHTCQRCAERVRRLDH